MEFWIVQAQEHPAEPRSQVVRREWRSNTLAEVLADRGHAVTRWRSSFSHHQKRHLTRGSAKVAGEGYDLQFIDAPAYERHIGLRRVRSHRALAKNFLKLAASGHARPDLIHVGNVPIELCHAAVRHGQDHGIPVVIDVRDLWPDVFADLIPRRLGWVRRLVLAVLTRRSAGVTQAFRGATAITALTPPFLEWGLEKAGRSRNDLDAVLPMAYPDFVPADTPAAEQAVEALLGRSLDGKTLVVFAGNLGTQFEFGTVVSAASLLAQRCPQIEFVLAGDGPELERLQNEARGTPNLTVPGWLEGTELNTLLTVAAIGLACYKETNNFLGSVPNKIPEYLSAGLAIACGLEGEMGNLVLRYDCGFVYRGADPSDLADQLERLVQNPTRLKSMREAARALHRSKFSGAEVYGQFADQLERIAGL